MISGTKYQQQQQIHLSYLRNHVGDLSDMKNSQDLSCMVFSEQDNESRISQNNREFQPPSQENKLKTNVPIQKVISEIQIGNPTIDSKQDINKIQPQLSSQSTGVNLSISSLEIDPTQSKVFEFFQNIIFLVVLQLLGPFLTTYVLWKYEFLKNLPLYLKVKTAIHITFKSAFLTLTIWIMIISFFMGEEISSHENYDYYKIEFIVNVVTSIVATIGGAVLGKNALFNNKFFSELYYLSEQKLKKMMTSKSSASNAKLGFLSSLHQTFFSKGCCNELPFAPEHPLDNLRNNESLGVFQNIQRERKIEERMTKVMKQLYIDSQTFTFTLLPFSLDNPLQKKITASCHERKQSEEQNNDEEEKVVFECPSVAHRSRKMFRRLQTIKIQEIKMPSHEKIPEQNEKDNAEQDHQNEDYQSNSQINGRKLCNELLIFCEKQESLNPNYFKKFCYCLFIGFKGFLPCFFRLYDGLGFYGDNYLVGITCQMNRQLLYAIFIGFLLFSIDLDIMNSYMRLTNKLIDYSLYLEENKAIEEKSSSDRHKKPVVVVDENPLPSPPQRQNDQTGQLNLIQFNQFNENKQKDIDQNQTRNEEQLNNINVDQVIEVIVKEEDIKIEIDPKESDQYHQNSIDGHLKNTNINQETQQESNQTKDGQKSGNPGENFKGCCNQNKDPNEPCTCCERQNSFNEEEDDIFGHSNHTPSIDFTDIHSLIAWNNMRKLGFHYKQKDIVLIDRISIIFCLELLLIMVAFLLNYFEILHLGKEYKQTWFIIMILLDFAVVIYTQLNRVHIQTQINKSFLCSVKAIIKVQYLLQQSHLIDVQKHIIINKYKKKDLSKDDQILQFFLKIKSKMLKHESNDSNYYNKIMKIVQFIQNDIRYDLENDQLHFLGLIKATPAFEATLFTSVVGLIYWLFRVYMKYINVDIGLLGQ